MKCLTIEQSDGSVWAVPLEHIALSRATHYAREFGDDIARSLAEDTNPLFESDPFEAEEWAANNMNWPDVEAHAFLLTPATGSDFQEAWMNGEKDVVEVTP